MFVIGEAGCADLVGDSSDGEREGEENAGETNAGNEGDDEEDFGVFKIPADSEVSPEGT